MNIPQKYKGKYFYHFTHIDNIPSIVAHNGLFSTNQKNAFGINHHNVALMNIQNRRSEMKVSVGPGGVVHDYVPFYFASTNIMLLSLLNRKIVDQPYVVFMAVSIEKLLEEKVVFTDASANTTEPPRFYDDPNDLDQLNWELIDSTKWGTNSDFERHARMAEVLVYDFVPLNWIDTYIVSDKIGESEIINCYKKANLQRPNILYDWFNNRGFFFKKFFFENRKNEPLVTGPIQLNMKYKSTVDNITSKRKCLNINKCIFKDLRNAISKIDNNFCIVPELAGIYNLETDNQVHHESVSDHTITVVNNLPVSQYYSLLDDREKGIVKLAAYFHDIGKGPREKWSNGIQKVYPDHPADALPMLERILSEDFEKIKYDAYKDICLLVAYHDLLSGILDEEKPRSIEELYKLSLSDKELYMLAALSEADIRAIGGLFAIGIQSKICNLVNQIMR
ncbi:MAG: DUF4433 domain-containing protein [Lachnospiraceae bacterium]|jgi:hypothetical protein|nr:DUF4433 domain-containing protein [Lachnospiraceae bacterium]